MNSRSCSNTDPGGEGRRLLSGLVLFNVPGGLASQFCRLSFKAGRPGATQSVQTRRTRERQREVAIVRLSRFRPGFDFAKRESFVTSWALWVSVSFNYEVFPSLSHVTISVHSLLSNPCSTLYSQREWGNIGPLL